MKRLILLLLLGCAIPIAYAQGIPLKINYQGKVEVNGVPFDGGGQFKFALTNLAGDTYYWTNDGSTPAPPASPTTAVSKNVSSGQYSIELGDITLLPSGSMTPIPVTVFNTPGVYLRIWFNDGSTGEQLLAPDKQLTSVPFAYMAEKVAPLSITGKNLTRESVWPEHEGRSNTVVSYFSLHVGTTSTSNLTPIPSGKTFIITDIVVGAEPMKWVKFEVKISRLAPDNTLTILWRAGHWIWGYPPNTASPQNVSLKAGLPVFSDNTIQVEVSSLSGVATDDTIRSPWVSIMISGYEFANP